MRFLVFLLAICSVVSAPAKVVLSSLFTDNMVLQQQTDVQIWGMASPKKTVSIRPSWDQKLYTVRADDAGMWRTSLRTPVAGGPYSISLSDGEELMLRDVLIGEVWLCAGQSNMEMPLMGKANQPIADAVDMIVRAKPSRPIRICTIGNINDISHDSTCCRKFSSTSSVEHCVIYGISMYEYGIERVINCC